MNTHGVQLSPTAARCFLVVVLCTLVLVLAFLRRTLQHDNNFPWDIQSQASSTATERGHIIINNEARRLDLHTNSTRLVDGLGFMVFVCRSPRMIGTTNCPIRPDNFLRWLSGKADPRAFLPKHQILHSNWVYICYLPPSYTYHQHNSLALSRCISDALERPAQYE
jgi:hypothetical protein